MTKLYVPFLFLKHLKSCSQQEETLWTNSVKGLLLKTGIEVDCTEPALVCAIALPLMPGARCPEQHLISPLITQIPAGASRDRAESAILKTLKMWPSRALHNFTHCRWWSCFQRLDQRAPDALSSSVSMWLCTVTRYWGYLLLWTWVSWGTAPVLVSLSPLHKVTPGEALTSQARAFPDVQPSALNW